MRRCSSLCSLPAGPHCSNLRQLSAFRTASEDFTKAMQTLPLLPQLRYLNWGANRRVEVEAVHALLEKAPALQVRCGAMGHGPWAVGRYVGCVAAVALAFTTASCRHSTWGKAAEDCMFTHGTSSSGCALLPADHQQQAATLVQLPHVLSCVRRCISATAASTASLVRPPAA